MSGTRPSRMLSVLVCVVGVLVLLLGAVAAVRMLGAVKPDYPGLLLTYGLLLVLASVCWYRAWRSAPQAWNTPDWLLWFLVGLAALLLVFTGRMLLSGAQPSDSGLTMPMNMFGVFCLELGIQLFRTRNRKA
jgi:drug/metabolite transporter (DMT)-like permease